MKTVQISSYRAVTENKHKSFHSSFIITMWADNEKELFATVADITAILESDPVKICTQQRSKEVLLKLKRF
jgi:hypothetical protein